MTEQMGEFHGVSVEKMQSVPVLERLRMMEEAIRELKEEINNAQSDANNAWKYADEVDDKVEDLNTIPSDLSDLYNDMDFVSSDDIRDMIKEEINDFFTEDDLGRQLSELVDKDSDTD